MRAKNEPCKRSSTEHSQPGCLRKQATSFLIAREIRADWKQPYFGAVPYLSALADLNQVTENYGDDSGKSVVAYFLSNAQTWRGPVAKRVKAELKALIK